MLSLAEFNVAVLAAAVLIGVVTARWAFRGGRGRHDKGDKGSS